MLEYLVTSVAERVDVGVDRLLKFGVVPLLVVQGLTQSRLSVGRRLFILLEKRLGMFVSRVLEQFAQL